MFENKQFVRTEIDIQSRLQELGHYQKITRKLSEKFNDVVRRYNDNSSQESTNMPKPSMLSSSTKNTEEMICTECQSTYPHKNDSPPNAAGKSTNEPTICATCSSQSNNCSPIWLLSRSEKLHIYENAINEGGHLTEPEMAITFDDGLASSSNTGGDDKKTFAEITKYKRDVKRKRMKYRTTKAPPLTHTEELRGLISLQMELWEDFVVKPK